MNYNLHIGMTYEVESTVHSGNTAIALGSGDLPVLATPAMIALMEEAAMKLAAAKLPADATSVGVMMQTTHSAATPLDMKIRATAELTAIDGRKLTFAVAAYDTAGSIGSGIHERFIVDREKFMRKINAKAD